MCAINEHVFIPVTTETYPTLTGGTMTTVKELFCTKCSEWVNLSAIRHELGRVAKGKKGE